MTFKVTTLDRRHSGYPFMKYMLEPIEWPPSDDSSISGFKKLRMWMWDQFGPGCELDFIQLHATGTGLEAMELWAWRTSAKGHRKIYLKSDAELAWFKLKWE
jgi:hypothetical protein